METPWPTADKLATLAINNGFADVTLRKIERWRKASLLPRPRRISLGRGKGFRSEYPPEAGPHLLALCRLRKQLPRNLDGWRFVLWLEGFAIAEKLLKASIRRLLRPMERLLTAPGADALDKAEHIAKRVRPQWGRSRWGRHLQARFKEQADLDSVITALMQMLQGETPAFAGDALEREHGEVSLDQLWVQALGLDRAQTDHLAEAKPWLPQEIAPDLTRMAEQGVLALPVLLQTLEDCSLAQLVQARADMTPLLDLRQMTRAMEAYFGPNPFGFGLFRDLPVHDPMFLAWFLVSQLRARQVGYGPGIQTVGATVRHLKPTIKAQTAFIKALRKELPDLARVFAPARQQATRITPELFAQRIEALRAMAPVYKESLDAFFQRHPELAILNEE